MSRQQQAASNWSHSVAGGIAGSAAVLALHPFDVIKTRLQVQDGHQSSSSTYRSAVDAVRSIYRNEGWRAFYNGLVPAWLGSGVAWAAYFSAYEAIKAWHSDRQEVERLSMAWHTISAAQAGAMVCLMTNPIWLIKTRLQLQTASPAAAGAAAQATAAAASAAASSMDRAAASLANTASTSAGAAGAAGAAAAGISSRPYKGFVDAVVRIGREEGIKGYYKGLGPSLVLQTTHGAVQFAVYEELKYLAARYGTQSPQEADRRITSLETSLYAATSKLAASITTYPSQVVRSRVQQRFEGRTLVYHNAREVVRLTWQREGVRGFYRGLGPALLRVMPQSAVTLTVYENVLAVLRE